MRSLPAANVRTLPALTRCLLIQPPATIASSKTSAAIRTSKGGAERRLRPSTMLWITSSHAQAGAWYVTVPSAVHVKRYSNAPFFGIAGLTLTITI